MQGYPTTPDPQPSSQQTSQTPPFGTPTPTGAPPFVTPSPAPGATTPSSNRKKLLIGGGIGCGVLLVLCMCAGLLSTMLANGSTSANTGGSPAATHQQGNVPAGTPLPTATPKPTATATPQPKWVVTHTFKGNGIQKTEPFTENSDHWKIAWSCNPKAYGFQYNLIADLTAPGDDFGDSVVNVICNANDPSSISGETNEYSSGTFYLDVNSEGPWTFQVEEFK